VAILANALGYSWSKIRSAGERSLANFDVKKFHFNLNAKLFVALLAPQIKAPLSSAQPGICQLLATNKLDRTIVEQSTPIDKALLHYKHVTPSPTEITS
jgi:hypothetical protein